MTRNLSLITLILSLFAFYFPLNAQKYPDSLIVVLEKEKSDSARLDILYALSEHYAQNEKPALSLKFARQALDISLKQKNFTYGTYYSSLLIGDAYYAMGSYSQAIVYFEESLKLARKFQDSLHIGITLNGIGILYWDIGEFEKALQILKESSKYDYLSEDERNTTVSYMNMGGVLSDLRHDSALYYLNIALKHATLHQITDLIPVVYNNIGDHYLTSKQYYSAEKFFKMGLDSDPKDLTPDILIYLNCNIALACLYTNRIDLANKYARRGLKLVQESQIDSYLINYYEVRYKIDSASNNFKSALKYHQLLKELTESGDSKDYHSKLANFQSLYELDRRNSEIELLRQNSEAQYSYIRNQKLWIYSISILALLLLILITAVYLANKNKKKANSKLKVINKELKILASKLSKKNFDLHESNIGKGKFISILAHDLKNPLNSVYGLTELLESEFQNITDEEKLDYIRMIHLSAAKITELLEDMLEWSRSQSHHIKCRPEIIDLNTISTDALDYLMPMAQDKNIKLKNNIADKTFAFADLHMIFTIIRNLVSNAIKFSHENSTIDISYLDDTENLIIKVKDNGIGMEESTIHSLFKNGQGISTPGTNNETGTGLGLSICKEFISANHGEIGVESTLGSGSTFWFSVPKKEVHA